MSSTSMGSLIARTGFQARQTPTRVLVTLARAAMNSISGKPTKSQRCSHPTRAKQLVRNGAKGHLVGITSLVKGMMVSVTRMSADTVLATAGATMVSVRLRPSPTMATEGTEDTVATEATEATEVTVMATASNMFPGSSDESYFA